MIETAEMWSGLMTLLIAMWHTVQKHACIDKNICHMCILFRTVDGKWSRDLVTCIATTLVYLHEMLLGDLKGIWPIKS